MIKLIIIIINIFLPIIFSKKLYLKLLNKVEEIKITIKGNGDLKILSSEFHSELPSEVLINGITESINQDNIYNLPFEENIISIRWNNQLTCCSFMFHSLTYITEIDFSNFNSSKCTTMDSLFYGCSSLESINFKNFDTHSVISMSSMFLFCSSLKSLDLSYFNTSKNKDMMSMFEECSSLISLDLSNFDTSLVTSCSHMFNGCSSLIYLDFRNFSSNSLSRIAGMFTGCNYNLIYCLNITNNIMLNSQLSQYKNNCSFFNNKKTSPPFETCENNFTHRFEYKNICYKNCPNGTHISSNNNYSCELNIVINTSNFLEISNYITDNNNLDNDTTIEIKNNCDIKCENCSMLHNFCISCNIKEKYYPKYN